MGVCIHSEELEQREGRATRSSDLQTEYCKYIQRLCFPKSSPLKQLGRREAWKLLRWYTWVLCVNWRIILRALGLLYQLLTEYSSGDNMPLCPVLYKPLKKMPLLWGTVPYNCEVLREVKGWHIGHPISSGCKPPVSSGLTLFIAFQVFTLCRHRVHGGVTKSLGW